MNLMFLISSSQNIFNNSCKFAMQYFILFFTILNCIYLSCNAFQLKQSQLQMSFNRSIMTKAIIPSILAITSIISPAFADLTPAPWDSNVKYEVVKKGTDEKPVAGDLVIVRFKGSTKGIVFDDTFSTSDPYYYRCGVGIIIKGLDDAILNMHVGDRYRLQFGGDLAFPNGRPSAPGRPRISPGANVDYEVELIDVPGKGEDKILDFE